MVYCTVRIPHFWDISGYQDTAYLSGLLSVGDPPVETKRLKGVEGALDALDDLPGYVPAKPFCLLNEERN